MLHERHGRLDRFFRGRSFGPVAASALATKATKQMAKGGRHVHVQLAPGIVKAQVVNRKSASFRRWSTKKYVSGGVVVAAAAAA